ncbi:GNAT family N-acetyltransferase [Streptomyces hydrogenans]|uniref:GNAT family N-acetyltransferase n=1 Tax=Streptomyces hydrogenans TaxID=1873719 RepID=UPI0035D77AAF
MEKARRFRPEPADARSPHAVVLVRSSARFERQAVDVREQEAAGEGVTVGYGIAPGERGKGYASEALAAVIGVARAAGATVLRGDADPANAASHRVMERAGMRRAGDGDGLVRFLVELGG